MLRLTAGLAISVLLGSLLSASAAEFPYRRDVTLSVGKSIVLKGVRGNDCSERAPSWSHIAPGLPKSSTGTFSDGGTGTVLSNSCGKTVGARGVKFTAKQKGSESFVVYDDKISVTVQ